MQGHYQDRPTAHRRRTVGDGTASCQASGFTIVELLASIGVLMLLIGLIAPGMAAARERARAQLSASNVRQIAQSFLSYTADEDGFYPIGEEGRLYAITFDGHSIRTNFKHFEFSSVWPVLLRSYAPWDEHWQIWFSPGRDVEAPGSGSSVLPRPSYVYSQAFLAKGQLWTEGRIPDERSRGLLTGNRAHEVVYPASKVMLWDQQTAYLRRHELWLPSMHANPAPMAFADLHVIEQSPRDAVPGVVNVWSMGAGPPPPLHNTPMGVRGRDYE